MRIKIIIALVFSLLLQMGLLPVFSFAQQFSGGSNHTLKVCSGGTIMTWGGNNKGQLGNGIMANSDTPIEINLTDVVVVSGGTQYSLALKNDGTVWAWGWNSAGQLGDNTTTDRHLPVQVKGDGGIGFLTDIIAISIKASHSLALKNDGTVWAWGLNNGGQLGNNSTANSSTPVQVHAPDNVGFLTGIIAISTGNNHSFALKNDGTVWAWGTNTNGQLGDGTTTQRITPVQVHGSGDVGFLTGITSISGGTNYSLVLKNDGTAWAWGSNTNGQLGDGTTTQRLTPVQVHGPDNVGFLTGITTISVGNNHSFALKTDGTVWGWGINTNGKLGDGTTTQRLTPVQVHGPDNVGFLTDIITIAGGSNHSFAVKTDGTVWVWGLNTLGQLGDGTTTNRLTPVQIIGLCFPQIYSVQPKIAANAGHSFKICPDGTVMAWGQNDNGQLGDGTTTQRYVPVQLTGLNSIITVFGGISHSVALKNDGTVWAWGSNTNGQLGDGTITQRLTPVQVVGLTDIAAISVADHSSLALKNDGSVWAWGSNGNGQLGDGTIIDKWSPVQVHGPDDIGFLTGIISLSDGGSGSCALRTDGTVWTWGSNSNGQLGDGTTTQRLAPVQVHGPGDIGFLSGIVSVSTGYAHSIALKNDGTIWAWGYNGGAPLGGGQLGDGTTTQRLTPVQVHGAGDVGFLTDIIAVTAGTGHTLALKNDGTVWAWGRNSLSQLGDGTTTERLTPVQVHGSGNIGFLTGITILSAGNDYSLALKNDESVWGWGINNFSQLGDNTTTTRNTPVQTIGICSFLQLSITQQKIAAGYDYNLKICSDGTVMAWGVNDYGQLGDGTNIQRLTPVQVHGPDDVGLLSGIVSVSSAYTHSLALKNDGTVWAWGDHSSGQLGVGDEINISSTPLQVHGPGNVGFLTNIVSVSGGFAQSYALKSDGTVWAWGYNTNGQLGEGTDTLRSAPVQVHGPNNVGFLENIISLAPGSDHVLALRIDGTVWAWGYNFFGQLGSASTAEKHTPVQVHGPGNVGFLTDIIAIGAGNAQSYALKNDGTAWAWGYNSGGQLGDGTTTTRYTPVQVHGPGNVGFFTDVVTISGGNIHSVALKNDGTVWTWGYNADGQLGDGTTAESLTPVQVHGPDNVGFLTGITDISVSEVGAMHTLALKNDGIVWAWGNNLSGQLGDSTITNRNTPVQPIGLCLSPPASSLLVLNGAYISIKGGNNSNPVFLVVDGDDTSSITRLGTGGHIYTEGQYDFVKWKAGTGTGNYVFPFGVTGTAADFIPFTFNKTTSGTSDITVSTWSTNAQNMPHPGVSAVPACYVMKGTGDSITTALDRFWDVRTSAPVTADLTFSYRGSENTTSSPTDPLKAQRWAGGGITAWSSPVGTGNTGVASGIGTVGPITAQNTFTPFVLIRAAAPLIQINISTPVSFAILKKKLDGGYYKINNNKLYFTYEEEYNNGNLNYKIFDDQRTEILMQALTRNYGDNRYTLDFSSSPLSAGYYTLEVTSEKNEIYLLKFKY